MKPRTLTFKQEKFCHGVVTLPNASEAYRAAYNCKNMKPESVNANAGKMIADTRIALRIEQIREKLAERWEVNDLNILAASAAIAYYDPADAYDKNGRYLDIRDMPKEFRMAIKSFEVFEEYAGSGENRELIGYTKKLVMHDKNPAHDRLMKHLGLFLQDNQQKSGDMIARLPREQQKLLARALRELVAEDNRLAEGALTRLPPSSLN
ncbi:MAG: terminase small subunit [Pyrinomonadaceae bacterium]